MTPRRIFRNTAASVALAALSLHTLAQAPGARPKIPPKYPASPMEIAYLPKYCYQQYVDGSLTTREFSIQSEACGYEMNHFCPALVYMTRASQLSWPKNERRGAINSAMNDIEYTIRGMKPGCYITDDVYRAREKAKLLSTTVPR